MMGHAAAHCPPPVRPVAAARGGAAAVELVVTTTDDVVNGETSSPEALIAHPGKDGISLREALLAVSHKPGPNTITFASQLAGMSIVPKKLLPAVSQAEVTITGLTNPDGTPAITLDGSRLPKTGPILFVYGSSFMLSGISFPFIPPKFCAIQIGGRTVSGTGGAKLITNVTISGNGFTAGNSGGGFAIDVGGTGSGYNKSTISQVTIANNSFDTLFEAIRVGAPGSDHLIENVTISGNGFSNMIASSTSAVELGELGRGNQTLATTISNNTFTNNFQGIVIDNGGADGTVSGTVISANTFIGNLGAIGLDGGVGKGVTGNSIANTTIVNNVVSHTSGDALQIIGAANNQISGVAFVNNTSFGTGPTVWVQDATGVSNVSILNTIAWGSSNGNPNANTFGDFAVGPDGAHIAPLAGSQVRNSITAQSAFAGSNGNIDADPLFVDSADNDFQLGSGSPAIGAGSAAAPAPTTDIEGCTRPDPPSIGAYEFGDTGSCS
jgi:hypothetical protein